MTKKPEAYPLSIRPRLHDHYGAPWLADAETEI